MKHFPSHSHLKLVFLVSLIVWLGTACTFPSFSRRTPTPEQPTSPTQKVGESIPSPTSQPTPTQRPLSPALVESQPPAEVELGLQSAVTFYFNQAMDQPSVEQAFKGSFQEGQSSQGAVDLPFRLEWQDNATVSFHPEQPYTPGSSITFQIATSARSSGGLPLEKPVEISYQTAGFLRVEQALPEPGSVDVDPTSAIVAAFNRPVVPLGADPLSLPGAITVLQGDQPAAGRGEWLNTSTYIFYPEPSFPGGINIRVDLNPELRGVDGTPLELEGVTPGTGTWSFTTALPALLVVSPVVNNGIDNPTLGDDSNQAIALDSAFALRFNQPMDEASVQLAFELRQPGGTPLPGTLTWNEDRTEFTFQPASLLLRDTPYEFFLAESAQSLGGTPLTAPSSGVFWTVPELTVLSSQPGQGGMLAPYSQLEIFFSSSIDDLAHQKFISIEPAVPDFGSWWDSIGQVLRMYGTFAPSTDYVLTISADLPDAWGKPLGRAFVLRFRTAPLPPSLEMVNYADAVFLTTQDTSLQVQAANLDSIPASLGTLTWQDFLDMTGPDSYEFRQSFVPENLRQWTQPVDISPNLRQPVDFYVTPERTPLSPGLYMLRWNLANENIHSGPFILVVSPYHLTLKISPLDALVWVVDLRNGQPLPDAPVSIYNQKGEVLASGLTDSDGVFASSIPVQEDMYTGFYAVLGQPGQELFGLASSAWNMGIAPWDFQVWEFLLAPKVKVYFYTDRPIYRPGDIVFFRAILREAFNGRYQPANLEQFNANLFDATGKKILTLDLPLDEFGSAQGEFTLPADAAPGNYGFSSEQVPDFNTSIQVADYRKPEIDLSVYFRSEQYLNGEDLPAEVNARYFFDAPAGNVPLHWALYAAPEVFLLPGYSTGLLDTGWLNYSFHGGFDRLGMLLLEGDAQTAPDGTLSLVLSGTAIENRWDALKSQGNSMLLPSEQKMRYTLEVTVEDESGFPVSSRAETIVNPADFYIGLDPRAWTGQAGQPLGFAVQVVDWFDKPAGERPLQADFHKVVWNLDLSSTIGPYPNPVYVPQYTLVESVAFSTDADGRAELEFTPLEPGTYQLSVYSQLSNTGVPRSEVLVWVGGAGQTIWPAIPNGRLRLVPDRDNYQPGETAQVFVPNPFESGLPALVTIERGRVLRHQLIVLEPGGSTLPIPLDGEDAPNVYMTVTLLSTSSSNDLDFRYGLVNIPVEPVEQVLQVLVTTQPERAGPGEELNLDILVTDQAGNPVQGAFSLALVDKAVLALAEPNSTGIVEAFYGEQPLGVQTGLAMSVYTRRFMIFPGGIGGGGGDGAALAVARQFFPDTAYWDAAVVTGADGRAQVRVSLPDTLTTWQADLRGITKDNRVGEALAEIVTTKELLVRPAAPRFLVAGDHALLGAIVQNNTSTDLDITAALQASGLILDNPAAVSQTAIVPAGGRVRLDWWVTVPGSGDAGDDFTDITFSVQGWDSAGNTYADSVRLAGGALPVKHYSARQVFRTSGVLDGASEILELVSLPRSFVAQSGEGLSVELSPSLAGSLIRALDVLEQFPFDCTEQTVSRFLPNLETYYLLADLNLPAADLQKSLERNLAKGLQRLQALQNPDGGWGWWAGTESDLYTTAYVLYGLLRAQSAGAAGLNEVIQNAIIYVQQTMPDMVNATAPASFDRLAFAQYVLSEVNGASPIYLQSLFQKKELLSPWAQALLALAMEKMSPGSQDAEVLISGLETSVLRSSTGVHWEIQDPVSRDQNLLDTLGNTAVVIYALVQHDAQSPLLVDAVRYLMAHRGVDGAWTSTYTTAWTVLAMNQFLRASGELQANYAYSSWVNGVPLVEGLASGAALLDTVQGSVPLSNLYPDVPNSLQISRQSGSGQLYYTAALHVNREVSEVAPLSQGISLERLYPDTVAGQAGERIQVRLVLTLPEDRYFVAVEDHVPAGAEILDINLKTSQLGQGAQEGAFIEGLEPQARQVYDPRRPFQDGWGWWLFNPAGIYDDRITWSADFLPAGTYELTYTLMLVHPGEYQVLPARAWQFYFPEVQANSPGDIFTITP
jgi:alpha-2-macroglobulin